VRAEGGNLAVTVDATAELINLRPLALLTVDTDPIPTPTTQWLPAVSTSREAQDDPRGWYQRTLAEEMPTAAGVRVIQLATENLSPEERQQTSAFTRHTLQRSQDRVRPLSLLADTYSWTSPTWSAMVKADERVVTHAGIIYRVVHVGALRLAVGGVGGVMTLSEWRGRGYARAVLAGATAFVGRQLWAPFALIICPKADVGFYEHLGWSVAEGAIQCEQPGGLVTLPHEVGVYLSCQGAAAWPSGPIDLLGLPW
jgi:GNAT superfamily N-acetyltransferase